jgi:hypothetical protein
MAKYRTPRTSLIGGRLLHDRHTHRPFDAGWSSPVARQAHNLKVVGSNPTPATKLKARNAKGLAGFFMRKFGQFAPRYVVPRSAIKINALPSHVIAYRRVHVTRLAHGQTCMFAKRSETKPCPARASLRVQRTGVMCCKHPVEAISRLSHKDHRGVPMPPAVLPGSRH